MTCQRAGLTIHIPNMPKSWIQVSKLTLIFFIFYSQVLDEFDLTYSKNSGWDVRSKTSRNWQLSYIINMRLSASRQASSGNNPRLNCCQEACRLAIRIRVSCSNSNLSSSDKSDSFGIEPKLKSGRSLWSPSKGVVSIASCVSARA